MKIEFMSTEDDGKGHFIVQRRVTDDSGIVHEGVHVFPHDVLEWRAAEYGIDPADTNTLMDIVLAEPYLTPDDWAEGAHLYDGTSTVDEARTAHIARCAKAKLTHRISTRGKAAETVRTARDTHVMNPEALQIKKELVARGREHQRRARHTVESDRLSALRSALNERPPA